jgi:hypothetical protein
MSIVNNNYAIPVVAIYNSSQNYISTFNNYSEHFVIVTNNENRLVPRTTVQVKQFLDVSDYI